MCGIFGFSGREGQKADLLKLKILGVYNTERGTDSCGYYYNGNVQKGVLLEKDFKDFIAENDLESGDLNCEVFIGHTRKSTWGTNIEENAHPFEVGDLVLSHNGTLNNIRDLAKEAGITEWFNVDSEGLAMVIEHQGFYVLEKYVGFAALAMTWRYDSDALYLFQGASRNKKDDEFPFYERPIYTLAQPEGLYYSSMENSLLAISSDGTKPIRLVHNVVVQVVKGEFTDYKFTVEREYANVKEDKKEEKKNKITYNLPSSSLMENNENDIIREDPLPLDLFSNGKIYVRHGRYYIGNQLLDGEYRIDRDGDLMSQASTRTGDDYYFIRGIMMKNLVSYTKARDEQDLNIRFNIADLLSKYSRYPIFCLEEEGGNAQARYRNKWYKDGKIITYKDTFIPKFSKKAYRIKEGRTIDIKEDRKDN